MGALSLPSPQWDVGETWKVTKGRLLGAPSQRPSFSQKPLGEAHDLGGRWHRYGWAARGAVSGGRRVAQ